jgi:hypothetical protein
MAEAVGRLEINGVAGTFVVTTIGTLVIAAV